MAYKFEGTTATVAGTASVKVLSITDNDGGGEIDVTHSESSKKEYEAEMDDPQITIECIGADGISRGDSGATTITWNDSGSTSETNSIVTGKQKSGSLGDKVVYSLTVRRTPA